MSENSSKNQRFYGTVVVILAALGLVASLLRVGMALGGGESDVAVSRALWPILGLGFTLPFGWWVRTGHRRGRSYGWAFIGPFLIGVAVPGGFLLLVINLIAARQSRRAGDLRQE